MLTKGHWAPSVPAHGLTQCPKHMGWVPSAWPKSAWGLSRLGDSHLPKGKWSAKRRLGSEPKQIPEPKAGLALNAADRGLHQHSTQCPLRVSPSGLQPALDLTAGPLPPAPGQTSISHLSQIHAAPRPSQGLLRQALNQSPKLGGGGKPQPARRKPKTERFTWQIRSSREPAPSLREMQSPRSWRGCTGGWAPAGHRGALLHSTPPVGSQPQAPRAPAPLLTQSTEAPAAQDTVFPPPNRQGGCSRPADGTSLGSQAAGQSECQSKGNSRRGRGLAQLGLVRQGTSSKGQLRTRVASPGGRKGRRQL